MAKSKGFFGLITVHDIYKFIAILQKSVTMPLPIFLRPLLLIEYYWQMVVYTLNRWLQRSNDELFGPLEQMIVAVVITGIAMNPSLVMNTVGPMPMNVPYPVPIPQYPPGVSLPPDSRQAVQPQSHEPQTNQINENAEASYNDTTSGPELEGSEFPNTGHPWLDILLNFLPPYYRPNPITIALRIMLISLLIHIVPDGFFGRLRESWVVFWPPWQDRSAATASSSSSYTGERRSRDPTEPSKRPDKDGRTSQAKIEAKDGSRAVVEVKASESELDKLKEREKEKERVRRKALAEYEAVKAVSKSRTSSDDNAIKVETATAEKKPEDITQSEKARAIKADTPAARTKTVTAVPTVDADPDLKVISDPDDPLMAGDYRPLRSVLKKSIKKPRQSKNVHHNLFMTMRGHQPHLVPFPHGLHPPPHEPRHTLWWNNIPKESRHLMAPPPPPKAVKEDAEEAGAKSVVDVETGKVDTEVKVREDGVKVKAVRVGDIEDEKSVKPTESEMRARAKEKEAEKKQSSATATAKIEMPTEPDIPVDPQVQKATWASQAMLCLLLLYIQQQLGLVLLAFFAWQQLNTHAERQQLPDTQPIAIVEAEAVAEQPVDKPKSDDIPREMREKLDRATRQTVPNPEKEESKREVNEIHVENEKPRAPKERDKGKSRAVTIEEASEEESREAPWAKVAKSADETGCDPGGSARIKLKEKMKGMSSEDRKKYESYLAQRQQRATEATTKLGDSQSDIKIEPRVLSKEEKEAYYKSKSKSRPNGETQGDGRQSSEDRDRRNEYEGGSTRKEGGKKRYEDLTDDDKARYRRQREERKGREANKEAKSLAEARPNDRIRKIRFENLTDDEKRRCMRKREKRKAREAERDKRGSRGEGSSGLTASEKERL